MGTYLLLDSAGATTLGGGITRIGYVLRFTTTGALEGLLLASCIGFFGSLGPAIDACWRPRSARVD
ncbi:MAG: hypothetical protein AAF529_08500 [Pseudomonadota bacterium]